MSAVVRLVEVVVTHDYFSAAALCQFDFLPDMATLDWLRRSGCILRAQGDRLAIFGDAARVAVAAATTLTFAARPCDPNFDRYIAPTEEIANAGPLLVFNTRLATAAGTDGSFDLSAACTAVGDATLVDSEPGVGFVILIATDGPLGAEFRIGLRSRSVRWKYLLAGDWTAACLVVAGGATAFTRQAAMVLANGETAIVFLSDHPISLGDRSTRSLRSHDEHGAVIVRRLPLPNPANIVREDPADSASLIAEIYVAR